MGQPKQHITHKPKVVGTGMAETDEAEVNESGSSAQGLKPVLMEAIQDVLDELETVYDNVSKNAKDHVHSESVIFAQTCWPYSHIC
jgi:translation initiation factor eIF-2B subunit beta